MLPTVIINLMVSWQSRNERGAGLVEYALLVALIALACIGGVLFFGTELSGKFDDINSSIE